MTGIFRTAEGQRLVLDRYEKLLAAWPVEHERRRVTTPEGETFVLVSGPEDAPPLVLLHGSMSNSAAWAGVVAELSTRFRVHSVDLIGQPGLSAGTRPPPRSGRYAAWLDAVLDGLGLGPVALFGVSLGGWVALDHATRHPERVERLVLACPAGIGRQRKGVLLRALLLGPMGERGQRRLRDWVLGPAVHDLAGQAADLMELLALMARYARPITAPLPRFGDERLRALRMPVLVLAGELDVMFDSRGTQRRLAATAPHAAVRLLPGVGHLVPVEPGTVTEFLTAPG